jgi:hypothetical protein
MEIIRKILYLLIFSVMGSAAAGCTPEMTSPQQIAAYPQSPGGDWYLPVQPGGGQLVYDAYLALDVRDPETAAAKANRIAEDYGGYLANSYTSFSNGGATITLELRIPPHNFESARRSFRTLGVLVRETVTGEWEDERPGWEQYAQFTLFFRRKTSTFSLPQTIDWHPGDTLLQALEISIRLLGFVVDLLIWIVVILGPFALIGWVVAWLLRRMQPSSEQANSIDNSSKVQEKSSDKGGIPNE